MEYNPRERCFIESNSGDRYFLAHWWRYRSTELQIINYEYFQAFPLEPPAEIPTKRKAQEFDFTTATPYACLCRGLVVHLTDERLAIIIGDPENYGYPGIRATILDDNFHKKETTHISPNEIIWTVNKTRWERNSEGTNIPIQFFFIPYDCFIAKGWQRKWEWKHLSIVGLISIALWILLGLTGLNLGRDLYSFIMAGVVFGTGVGMRYGLIPYTANFLHRFNSKVSPPKGLTSDAWDSHIRRCRHTKANK